MGDLIKRMRLNFLLLGLSAHFGFAQQRGRSRTATTSKSAIGIVENAFEILGNVVDYKENIAISPLSIVGGMYMLAAGSAGDSRQQILDALKFGDALENDTKKLDRFKEYYDLVSKLQTQPENGYTLNIANGVFHQKDMGLTSPNKLQGNYLDLLKENFIRDESHIKELDFQQKSQEATDEINSWVAEKTNNKIPQLFAEPLDSQTIVMLVSTLYFKASWNEKFELIRQNPPCYISTMAGFSNNQCDDDVTYMGKEEEVYSIQDRTTEFGPVNIFDLSLKNRKNKYGNDEHKFLMQIWAPDSMINENEEIDRKFREYIKNNLMTVRRKMKKTLAKIKIPVFEIDSDIELKNAMQQIGITDVFGQQADLSPMLGEDQEAQVSKINHAVKITVDQNGVEGAAATSIQITSRSYTTPKILHIIRPFYFVISNRCWKQTYEPGKEPMHRGRAPAGNSPGCPTGNVPIFIGRVVNPVAPK